MHQLKQTHTISRKQEREIKNERFPWENGIRTNEKEGEKEFTQSVVFYGLDQITISLYRKICTYVINDWCLLED